MKKICLFMFACTTLIGLTGCGSNNVEGSLEEIMTIADFFGLTLDQLTKTDLSQGGA